MIPADTEWTTSLFVGCDEDEDQSKNDRQIHTLNVNTRLTKATAPWYYDNIPKTVVGKNIDVPLKITMIEPPY